MQVKPKPDSAGWIVVAEGPYYREFSGPGPFTVGGEEWEKFLKPTGLFEEVESNE